MLWHNHGYTVTEQLVASLFALVVVGTLYGFYRDQLFHLVSQEVKTGTLADARGALDIMIRDLRNAGSWGAASAPVEKDVGEDPKNTDDPSDDIDSVCNRVYAATAQFIHIQMDLNGDGDCTDSEPRENVQYELKAATKSCPGPRIISRNGDCLVANVVVSDPAKLFTYYNSDGVDLGDIPTTGRIKRVKIGFSVQADTPVPRVAGAITSTLSSAVEFRN